ncbi:MAG: DEAD/DEAH box helicase [Bacteroidia bacterium]
MTFSELGLIDPIMKALSNEGYQTPTPIQAQAIPGILQKKDILGCAQTGTGKTAAFSIPMLQILNETKSDQKKHIRSLILTPTRELAIQIGESIEAYGRFLPLKHTVIFGGVSQKSQVNALQHGIDILVATPGRLLDLQQQGYIRLDRLDFFVLDEADRMLDMGFIHDVKRILKLIPEKRQTLFFSATMPDEIQKLSSSMLKNPVKVEVTPVSSTAETIVQEIFFVDKSDKKDLLLHVLKNKAITSALVFTRTKHGANKVVKDLVKQGISAEAIHGNKTQNARQKALSNFKAGKTRVLVATDIASRGIDIDQLSQVINYEIPNVPETYVHRIGRTGRAGSSGAAMSFCDAEETAFLRDIQRLIKFDISVNKNHEWNRSAEFSTLMLGMKKPAAKAPVISRPANSRNRDRNRKPFGRNNNRPKTVSA